MPFEKPGKKAERDDHAALLVVRVRGGDAEAREAAARWMSADPANAVAYALADAAWDAGAELRLSFREAADQPAEPPVPAEPPAPAGHRVSRRAIAAGLVAALGVGLAAPSLRRSIFGREIDTLVGERRDVVLSDGSVVRLNTASRIEVRMTAEARIVRLIDGEVLFDVAHDAQRPFLVDVGHTHLRAVGTAFNVRMRADLVELTVTDGIVAVADADDTQPLDRQPHIAAGGGAAIRQGTIVATSLDAESLQQRTAWRDGVIQLDGNTVEQAVGEFNRYRSSQIVVGDQRVATMRVGGRFGTSESARFITALQQTLPIHAIAGEDGGIMLVHAD